MNRISLIAWVGAAGLIFSMPIGDACAAVFKPLPRCGVPQCSHHHDPIGSRRPVDLVICLDTSGSMTALIDSARAKLWDVVNELSTARPLPYLRVGLLTYGSPNNSTARGGWINMQTNLTDDLDTVYAKMMGMSTSGGDEFVGWVLHDALSRMSWSPRTDALKIIFVAGNESADQAAERYNFRYVAENAHSQDIRINAIYGGHRQQGIAEQWNDVAAHGGGHFFAIDMEHGTIQIATPYDDRLSRLNDELNRTYIPYGARGQRGAANQLEQDKNAVSMGRQSCSSRVIAKAGALYSNSYWDLVDACEQSDFDLSKMSEKDLPETMQSMTVQERQAYVDGMRAAREAVQQKIKDTDALRKAFLAERQKSTADGSKSALHDAMLEALREQAHRKGFKFEIE